MKRQRSALARLKQSSPFVKGKKSAEQTKAKKQKALKASKFNPSLRLQHDKSRSDLAEVEFRLKLTFGI